MSSGDKYETLEKIGHGSFGVIRKVRRKADGFIMCRKEISYLKMSQREREQLHVEFQILSGLRHPNIVAYYHREHLKLSQDLHLYMEYCGNGDLDRVIKDLKYKGQRAQESFVWSIFSQLVMALYRCHYGIDPPEVGANILGLTQGSASAAPKVPAGTMTILHRDLKPENVFLGEDNSVKLGDFGLSKMIKSHDFASTYVGTPFYMSPEICAGEKYTLKSDIWSLGCIIYELCARDPPFNAKTHFELAQKIKGGRVAALPDMYSPELNQVIRDCLKTNPDRRPDTVQLLNLPVVKLMRKEKEVVDLNKKLKAREEALKRKERELNERLVGLDREKDLVRGEIDASLRREWEVKARLEIDRLANAEMEQLQKRFEDEVKLRVEAELQKQRAAAAAAAAAEPEGAAGDEDASSVARSEYPYSSIGGGGGASGDEFPSTTDMTEYSLDSPDTSREAKRSFRTPFGRAHTMFATVVNTPMDIEMASPSPIAIASLSLSPRRNAMTKTPTTHTGNIFAAHNAVHGDPKWDPQGEPTLHESDDEDMMISSPTRLVKSSTKKNPFTAKDRPVLPSQKSCPVNRLRSKASNTGLVAKAASGAAAAAPQPEARARSPVRQLSKIPSKANLQAEQGPGAARAAAPASAKKEAPASSTPGAASAAKNNIKGRTLVELQQARAGGRPFGAGAGENSSPKRAGLRERLVCERHVSGSGGGFNAVAVWDAERDEMPSPFLARQRITKA